MELKHIKGSSYYIEDNTNIGVYVFADRSCLLVDSGSSSARAVKIKELLDHEGLSIYAIFNTHAHADHCGGNQYLQEKSGCRIFASILEAITIENSLLAPLILFSASPPRVLTNRFIVAKPSKVTDLLSPGELVIKEERFNVVDLKGHSMGQCGLITPDGAVFIGDALMDFGIMDSYGFLYLADIEGQISSYERLRGLSQHEVVMSHGWPVKDLNLLISKNEELLQRICDLVLKTCQHPVSRDELLVAVVEEFKIPVNSSQYFLILSSISAVLSYLYNHKKIHTSTADIVMKFYV